MICVGLVIGAEELKPITWRVWAGQVERDSGGGGPFQGLEDRLGFMDIRVCHPTSCVDSYLRRTPESKATASGCTASSVVYVVNLWGPI